MKFIWLFVFMPVVFGCAPTISSTSAPGPSEGGVPYTLPKGLVPVQVFADSKGVGITIEPAKFAIDPEVGTIVARFDPNAFNNEEIKVSSDPSTGFLSTISTTSEAQLLAIVEEGAKSAARLAFQNSRAAFHAEKVVVLDDSFDPLSKADVDRINAGIGHAIAHAARAFVGATGERVRVQPVRLSVALPDGSDPFAPAAIPAGDSGVADSGKCEIGVCVRSLTSRIVRVEIGGSPFAGKLVNVPNRGLIPVPVPSTVFADQDITIGIKDGILEKSELKRDSEALGIVKLPGAAISGFVSGITQGLTDEKSILDKRKELAASEEALAEAEASRDETIGSLGPDSVSLQNARAGDDASLSDYAAATLTVYPFSDALTRALVAAIEEEERQLKEADEPNTGDGDDLVTPAPSE